MCNQASNQEITTGWLPKNLKEFLSEQTDDELLLTFYPKGCGFDRLAEDPEIFVSIEEFKELAADRGYKIIYCAPQRHLARFASVEELDSFMRQQFGTGLNTDEAPLKFPAKMIYAKLTASPSF
jgi:hypothetical protein